jgi:hypothetical protein
MRKCVCVSFSAGTSAKVRVDGVHASLSAGA